MKGFLLSWIADFSLLKYPRSKNEVFSSSTAQSQIILSLSHSGTSLKQCRLILKDHESLSLNAKSWFFFYDIPTRENYGNHYFEPSKSVNSFISRQGKGLVNFRFTARSHESLSLNVKRWLSLLKYPQAKVVVIVTSNPPNQLFFFYLLIQERAFNSFDWCTGP